MFIPEGKKAYSINETAEKTGLKTNIIRTKILKNEIDGITTGYGEVYVSDKGYKQAIEYAKKSIKEPEPKPAPKKPIKKTSKRILLDINTSEYGPYIRFRTEEERYLHALIKRGAEQQEISLASYLAKLLAQVI